MRARDSSGQTGVPKNGNQLSEFDFRPESVLVTLGLDVRRTALDVRVLASDLDPQANLTHRFLKEDRLEKRWAGKHRNTLFGRVNLIPRGTGDITKPPVEPIGNIGLLVGDLRVSGFEDWLSDNQPRCLDGEEAAFRVISAFYRGIELAAQEQEAGTVLIDFGPNLGAINRVAILSAQYVVVPLAPDLFSLQGLRNLGPI